MLLFIGQAGLASVRKSAAFDEEYHLAAGYAYLRTADFRMSLSHPPLINALSALPLLLQDDIQLPLAHPTWAAADYFAFSDQFTWWSGNDPQAMLVAARLPIIGLGALLLLGLFFWARTMIGMQASWVVLLLATFDPNILTNARLVTTDLGLTCLLLLTMWRLWQWLETPSWGNFLLAGSMAGLTTATKFTGVLLWPMILLIFLIYPNWRWRRLPQFFLLGGIAYFTLWAVFRFDVGPIPQFPLQWPVPAPFYPYSLWDTFMVIEEQPKPGFLLGDISNRGWWYYFPVALGLKTPLPTLVLMVVGVRVMFRQLGWRRSAVVWGPLTLFLAVAMSGRITIGYRHVLPVLPFILLLAGFGAVGVKTAVLPSRSTRFSTARIVLLALLVGWVAIRTLTLFPHQEAYFNELGGGPENGDRLLVDSNIDWGQDLILLREEMERRDIERVHFSYFGTAPPELYGINYWPLPGFIRHTAGAEIDAYNPYTPSPGWYAISATSLRLGLLLQNQDMYAYFQDETPVARVGYSIYLYEVTAPQGEPIRRTAVSRRSVSDIPALELGVVQGERLVVKWSTQESVTIVPIDENILLPPPFEQVDASFDFGLRLWGAVVEEQPLRPNEQLELTLYWQVDNLDFPNPAPASGAPLKTFIHLSDRDDPTQIIAQYDGWETAFSGLEVGDTIIHPIVLTLPNEIAANSYLLRLGLYNPQTGERYLVGDEGEETADFIALDTDLSSE